ncbi:hypothetical protein PV703_04350 [Streptomyces sp. ME01-24h]|nr:hypothetical protein [Streptomyces sp. ME19-03-3]MDX3352568.1 hypothetical protein [Streptomyces sp. ME01-24h]
MLPNTEGAADVPAIVMSLAAEADSLDAHVRRLHAEISAVDARVDAVHEALSALPAPTPRGPDVTGGRKDADASSTG